MKPVIAQLYVLVIRGWLRFGKPIRSKIAGRFQPKLDLDIGELEFDSFDEFANWLRDHTRWRPDPGRGLLDLYPHIQHLFWQLSNNAIVEDDCDGLSYFSATCVAPYCDTPGDRYLVDIVIDPFAIELENSAHSICIFRREGKWRVLSNGRLDPGAWDTFDEAVRQNHYAAGHPVLWWGARDVYLKRVPAPLP